MNFPVRKSLKGRRAVVIGSTAAGLAAAISLAVRGARVVVLESGPSPMPGGRIIEADGVKFQPPLAPLTSPAVLAELVSSAGLRVTDFLTLERDEVAAQVRLGKESMAVLHDPGLLATELGRLGDVNGPRLEALFARIGRLREGAEGLLRARAMGVLPTTTALRTLPDLLDFRTEWRQAHARFPQSAVRSMLLAFHPLAGLLPTTRGNHYWRWLGEYLLTGGWRVEGGSHELMAALLRLCDLLSVRILYRARVDRVELKDDRVRRVIVGDGQRDLAASLVVVADGQEAARYVPAVEPQRRPGTTTRQAMMTLYLALRQAPQVAAPITLLPSEAFHEEARAIERWRVPAGMASLAVLPCDAPQADGLEPDLFAEAEDSDAPDGMGPLHRLAVRAVVPASSAAWRWSEEQRDQEKLLMIDRLKEAGIFKDAGNDVEVSELRLSSLPTLGPSGDFAWRLPRWKKEHRIAGLYETKDAQLAGWSVSSEVLAGMAIAVRAARDAKGE